MPFKNPFKKDYKKLNEEENTNQHLSTVTVQQDIVPVANRDIFTKYKDILSLHMLDENSLSNYTTYVAEQLQAVKQHKKEVEAYFEKQKEYINQFIDTILEIHNYKKKLELEKDKSNKLQLEKRLKNLQDLISYCTFNFSRNKQKIHQQTGFKDTGPTLIQDGLVLYKA